MKFSKKSKIFIAGHKGMVGSACLRAFKEKGYINLISRTREELDLTNQTDVNLFIKEENPDIVIIGAAKVGGINANNTFGYDFLMENMLIQNNLLDSCNKNDVQKVIFLGSSCIYPKLASQPIKEESILTGSLEDTNQWYAIAKISGIKTIEALNKYKSRNYLSLMPTNLYGPNDNYDLNYSHVLPALIRKIHEAKENKSDVILWGSGSPLREFLHVDDLASAILFSIENNINPGIYNIGSGNEISILNLAKLIQKIIGHNQKIKWDMTKPDGTPRKILDSSKFKNLGWDFKISLETGICNIYDSLKFNNFNF